MSVCARVQGSRAAHGGVRMRGLLGSASACASKGHRRARLAHFSPVVRRTGQTKPSRGFDSCGLPQEEKHHGAGIGEGSSVIVVAFTVARHTGGMKGWCLCENWASAFASSARIACPRNMSSSMDGPRSAREIWFGGVCTNKFQVTYTSIVGGPSTSSARAGNPNSNPCADTRMLRGWMQSVMTFACTE